MMLDLKVFSACAAKRLHDLANSIEAASAPSSVSQIAVPFNASDKQTKAAIDRITKSAERDRAIYVITLDDDANAEDFEEAFDEKRKQKILSLPQYNKHQRDSAGRASRVIYVGSSCWSSTKDQTKPRTGTLRTRLTQHLIRAPKGTYALNLGEWTAGLAGGIIVDIYNYPAETSRDVVVAVEDALSQELKPICGRRGIQR